MSVVTKVPILHDGQRWLVVEKPAGLPTQAPSPHPSLERVLRQQLGDRADYLSLPHRLDVPVGGVLLVALTKKAARLLSEQFATGKVTKTYEAMVAGDATNIERSWCDRFRKLDGIAKVEITTGDGDGKVASTHVLDAIFDAGQNQTRLHLQPVTGRMHQLRIGAAARGFPILGDSLYAHGETTRKEIALRAVSIEFHDPVSGKRTKLEAEPLSWLEKNG